jgi:hypothetical protein
MVHREGRDVDDLDHLRTDAKSRSRGSDALHSLGSSKSTFITGVDLYMDGIVRWILVRPRVARPQPAVT